MDSIDQLTRACVRKLKPYSSARGEHAGQQGILLDANENPFDNGYNRYPDPLQKAVKAKMSALKGSGDYESADALADEALGIVFKDRVKQKQSHRDRDRGSLRAPTNRAKPPVEMTQDDAYRAAFEAAIDGDQKRLERVSRLRFR